MKRRELIKNIGLAAGAISISGTVLSKETNNDPTRKRVLRIAHITEVHFRPELDAPLRFRQCMEVIKKHKVDFFSTAGIPFMLPTIITSREKG